MIYLHTRVCVFVYSNVFTFYESTGWVMPCESPRQLISPRLGTCLICAKLNSSIAPSLRTLGQVNPVGCCVRNQKLHGAALLCCWTSKGDELAQIRITWEIETLGTCSTAFVIWLSFERVCQKILLLQVPSYHERCDIWPYPAETLHALVHHGPLRVQTLHH